jgi:hypothetical protein
MNVTTIPEATAKIRNRVPLEVASMLIRHPMISAKDCTGRFIGSADPYSTNSARNCADLEGVRDRQELGLVAGFRFW